MPNQYLGKMLKTVTFKGKSIKGAIELPASKSISNRLLILKALYGGFEIGNLSDARDTILLQKALVSEGETVDVGPAGTAMRFLLAYYAAKGETKILTGSDRMKERPIGPLVEALKQLGADITYLEKEGYPPVKINPAKLKGSKVQISGNVSSQFISALMMIGPSFENGLEIEITEGLVSESYVDLTIKLMEELGFQVQKNANSKSQISNITIHPFDRQSIIKDLYLVCPDWSAASYWYVFAALCDEVDVFLPGLRLPALQGDAIIYKWMKSFGVETIKEAEGVRLKRIPFEKKPLSFDFISNPDLAQTIIVLCAALDFEATFTGLQTLRIKETDRLAALRTELLRYGRILTEKDGIYALEGEFRYLKPVVKTYDDHRMAMAFAPLAVLCGEVNIENPEVVKKSYPNFWWELEKLTT